MASLRRPKDLLSNTKRRVMAFVAAVGTVASAIGGVYALLPKPTPALKASFSGVRAHPEVSLEQYDDLLRTEGAIDGSPAPVETGMVAYRLAAATLKASSSTSSGTVKLTVKAYGRLIGPAHGLAIHHGARITTTSPDLPFPSQRPAPAKTSASPPPRQSFHPVKGALVTEGAGTAPSKVAAVVKALSTVNEQAPSTTARVVLPKSCSSLCGATQEIGKVLTYDPDPVKAAEAVAAIFNDSRGEVVGRRIYPIGAMVSYTVELEGFAHEKATLEWSLLATGSGHAPPRPWWRDVVVAHIEPTVEQESLSGEFWVPVPPERGDYVVHLVLLDSSGVPHASTDSEPEFH